MQYMPALAFNPLKAARSLREAGADEKLAEAMASAIGDMADAVEGQLATKTDLNVLTSDLNALEQRNASAMEALEQRMKATLYRTLWLQTGVIIAAVTAVTKLLP